MKVIAPALALAATVFGFVNPATADPVATTYADLNGDGRPDRVTVRPAADNPDEQILTARIDGKRLRVRVPLDSDFGVRPPRVTDLDADGRDEVVVTQSVGANTNSFGVWGLYGEVLAPVTLVDGTPLRLWEGGGVSAISRYGCSADHDGRELVQVIAVAVDDNYALFEGESVTYVLDGAVATEVWRSPVRGSRGDSVFQWDPAMCG